MPGRIHGTSGTARSYCSQSLGSRAVPPWRTSKCRTVPFSEAGVADAADRGAGCDLLAFSHADLRQVTVQRVVTVAVIQDDHLAVGAEVLARVLDARLRDRTHGRSHRRLNVDAVVDCRRAPLRVLLGAERADERPLHGPGELTLAFRELPVERNTAAALALELGEQLLDLSGGALEFVCSSLVCLTLRLDSLDLVRALLLQRGEALALRRRLVFVRGHLAEVDLQLPASMTRRLPCGPARPRAAGDPARPPSREKSQRAIS